MPGRTPSLSASTTDTRNCPNSLAAGGLRDAGHRARGGEELHLQADVRLIARVVHKEVENLRGTRLAFVNEGGEGALFLALRLEEALVEKERPEGVRVGGLEGTAERLTPFLFSQEGRERRCWEWRHGEYLLHCLIMAPRNDECEEGAKEGSWRSCEGRNLGI